MLEAVTTTTVTTKICSRPRKRYGTKKNRLANYVNK